jgi:hypothetical protein
MSAAMSMTAASLFSLVFIVIGGAMISYHYKVKGVNYSSSKISLLDFSSTAVHTSRCGACHVGGAVARDFLAPAPRESISRGNATSTAVDAM